jgi:ATP-dependent Zn protease
MTESPLKNRRRPTAFHEAGHAIVGHFLGLEVHDICINDKDKSGDTKFVPKGLTRTERAIFLFAGMAAQNIWKTRAGHMSGGGDIREFLEFGMREGLSAEERDELRIQAHKSANAILLAHKSLVETVAEWLMEHGQMDSSEFLRLMQGT